jgi:hydroxyacylglutathione hydrolase
VILEHAAVEPFHKNGFVIGCEETREGVIIDPGDEVDQLLDAVGRHGLTITSILLTHAHLDHITGVGRAKQALGVPVWLHRDDNFLYERVVQQGFAFGFKVEKQPPVDRFYDLSTAGAAGDDVRFGRYQVRVLHTPGHCPGGVCLAV